MSAACAISGTIPEHPVVSVKSGHVYEKRLIEKHLKQNGTCPVTKEELRPEDLIDLKVNPVIRPRPPTATSLPGLLSLFQNEWDALMLETYTLKQHSETLRQELAHTLYKHDAACRVIARLIKERDEARAALMNTQQNIATAIATASGGAPPAAAAAAAAPAPMEEEETGMTPEVIDDMDNTLKRLSKGRKAAVKAAAAAAAPREKLSGLALQNSHNLHSPSQPGITALDITENGEVAVTGGVDGSAIVFNVKAGKIVDTLKGHKKRVTSVHFHPVAPDQSIVLTTSADATAALWRRGDNGKYASYATLREHKAEIVGASFHPSGNYLVTASADKRWILWDARSGAVRVNVADDKLESAYTCVSLHPDGLLLGAGTQDSQVIIYDVKTQSTAATFKGHVGAITSICFSENGYHLATSDDSGVVKLWDLRKLTNFHTIQDAGAGGAVRSIQFDKSGTYLAVCGKGTRVYHTKSWEQVANLGDHTDEVFAAKLFSDSHGLASVSKDRTLKIYGC